MKESGWLTKVWNKIYLMIKTILVKLAIKVKQSFLEILDEIEKKPELSEKYLLAL